MYRDLKEKYRNSKLNLEIEFNSNRTFCKQKDKLKNLLMYQK